jgi:hypothetical protein
MSSKRWAAKQWRDPAWRYRAVDVCRGCGYFVVAHKRHRDDCTRDLRESHPDGIDRPVDDMVDHARAIAHTINTLGITRVVSDEKRRSTPLPPIVPSQTVDDDEYDVGDDADDYRPTDDDEPATDAYREAMACYPRCGCGQPLLAPQSIDRGHCEACAIRLTGHATWPGWSS